MLQTFETIDAPAAIDSDLPFRLLADHLPALCFMADPRGRVLWCNRPWYDYTGLAAGADPDKLWPTVHDPAALKEINQRWRSAMRSGSAGEMVVRVRGSDARFRPFLTRAEPIRGADGSIECWLGTMTEIGEQREAEENQRFLVQLGDALRGQSDPSEILVVTGRTLGAHLNLMRVGYGEVEEDGNTVQAGGRGWQRSGKPGVTEAVSLDDFGPDLAARLRAGEVSVIGDVLSDPIVGRCAAAHTAHDIGASVTVPLIREGRLVALFYAHVSEVRAWKESEVRLISDVAERTWATLERAHAETKRRESEQKLRESEAWLRAIVEATPECVKLVDADGSLRFMNSAGMRMVDADAALIGCDIADIVAPEHRENWREQHRRVCAGEHRIWEFDVVGLNGSRRRVETHAVPLPSAEGGIQHLAVSRDITERKAAEAALAESEARFRGLVETAHEGIWIVDGEGSTLFVNERMAELLGTTRRAMHGRSVAEYCFPEEMETQRERIGNNLAGKFEQFEFRFRRLDGTPLPVLAATNPLRDGSGRIIGAVGMFSDLTERKLAEEKLRTSEALLAGFMNHAPIGMYLKDADGRYLMVNPEMCNVFGKPVEQILGRTAGDFLAADEAAMVAAHDREILADRRPRSVEEFLPGLDHYAWSMVVRFPITLEEGQPARIGGFDIDISDRKRTEEELARSREALYQSEKLTALGSLLAGVSHELNNPLSIVLTLSELLEQNADGTPFGERAAKIHAAAARCGKIVQTFLAMARQKAPIRERIEANALVGAALDLTGYGLRTADIVIATDLEPALPAISADADQLNQVLVNLILNAQHSLLAREDKRRLTIRTAACDRGQTVRIEIEDNGPGVPNEIRRRIFEPFFTSKPQGEGTGIGLTLSLGIVEAHGGSIRLHDPAGGGARFTITLPATGRRLLAAQPQERGAQQTSCGRVLVVDDEADLAAALVEILEAQGYVVDKVRSGAEAQGLLALREYDAVLTDMRMPGMDGPALFDWILRERPKLACRVAFITGDTLGPEASRFLSAAERPVLEKPFDLVGLRNVMGQLVRPGDCHE